MITLGINRSGHDGSVALLDGNKVLLFVQEERLTNIKYAEFVFQSINKVKEYVNHVDILAISGVDPIEHSVEKFSSLSIYEACIQSLGKSFKNNKIKVIDFSNEHHKVHAATAFYNSGFKEALCIVRDGLGSNLGNLVGMEHREHSSVFLASYPSTFSIVEQFGALHYDTLEFYPFQKVQLNEKLMFHNTQTEGATYERLAMHYGLGELPGPGKLMGMSSYGKEDSNVPSFFTEDGFVDKEFVFRKIDFTLPWFEGVFLPDDFQTRANYAYRLQKDLEKALIDYILNMLAKTNQKNVCLSGGVFLNCVANYKIRQALPKDVKLYVEPLCADYGNALGAAKLAYYLETHSTEVVPQTHLYYGAKYTYTIDDLQNEKIVENVKAQDVAFLLSQQNIVAIYQGGAESGPRALGNRSILYDPRDPKGKDHVNSVKNREWFRPFAGTVLFEKACDWFDLDSLDESPYMMYAVDVLPTQVFKIPAITHVDNTCRIQTLKKDVNPAYYDLIQEFESITGVPILFNTSFNLAGDVIVETLNDALKTIHESNIDYLYLPELQTLVKGRNK